MVVILKAWPAAVVVASGRGGGWASPAPMPRLPARFFVGLIIFCPRISAGPV